MKINVSFDIDCVDNISENINKISNIIEKLKSLGNSVIDIGPEGDTIPYVNPGHIWINAETVEALLLYTKTKNLEEAKKVLFSWKKDNDIKQNSVEEIESENNTEDVEIVDDPEDDNPEEEDTSATDIEDLIICKLSPPVPKTPPIPITRFKSPFGDTKIPPQKAPLAPQKYETNLPQQSAPKVDTEDVNKAIQEAAKEVLSVIPEELASSPKEIEKSIKDFDPSLYFKKDKTDNPF